MDRVRSSSDPRSEHKSDLKRGLKPELKPEWVFVALAIPFGLAFALALPPLDGADESRHFQRAFALSEGYLWPVGESDDFRPLVPTSLNHLHPPYFFKHSDGSIDRERGRDGRVVCLHDPRDPITALKIPLRPEVRTPIRWGGPYNPFLYIPQATALLLGRLQGLSAGSLLYLARFATLAASIALCWLALRWSPLRKWTLMMLCLGPMTLFQASFVSGDAINNAVALLATAAILRAALAPSFRVEGRHVGVLVALCASLGMIKQGLWAFGLLLLLIPEARFRSRRQRVAIVVGSALAMAICVGSWALAVRAANAASVHGSADGAVATLSDVVAMYSQFPAWLEALSRHSYRIWVQYIGILGHLDVVLPRWIYSSYPIALVAVALFDRDDSPGLTVMRRIAVFGIAGAALMTTLMLIFLAVPGIADANSSTVQGRYFVPFVPLLFLAIPGIRRMPRSWGPLGIASFCAVTLFAAAYTVATHYFIGTPPG